MTAHEWRRARVGDSKQGGGRGVIVWPIFFADEVMVVQAQHYGVGWGTLALINAGIAQGKNRSGLNWFLLSLLLGPVATFLLVAFFEKLQPPGTTRPITV